MSKVILYIAVSIDGYIADDRGAVDWISEQDENAKMEDTFTPFFSGVDTVIMGRKTYNQIVTELSPGQRGSNDLCPDPPRRNRQCRKHPFQKHGRMPAY